VPARGAQDAFEASSVDEHPLRPQVLQQGQPFPIGFDRAAFRSEVPDPQRGQGITRILGEVAGEIDANERIELFRIDFAKTYVVHGALG
jgi:hypothetical protein